MEELYARLQKASKLPGVVQEVGRRLFAKDGQFAQRQVRVLALARGKEEGLAIFAA